ncbi:MAG: DNA repair protein RecN [Spirochaetales bacterium]|nr:DNA repair protein RecN [Candidatus Physcosoma equi]
MLESLHVRNYVLIDQLDLDFSDGLTCLTGETGSGKSIILGALSLLLGAKADKEAVRQGEEQAEISGTFYTNSPSVLLWCQEHEIEVEEGLVLIRRVIKTNGRSSYSINRTPITRSEGEELGMLLVDVSSQHAHQSLMKAVVLRDMLDEAAESSCALASYREAYTSYKNAEKKLEELKTSIEKSAEEADYMKFCLQELDNADLKIGEEDELKEKLALQSSSEFIAENLESTQEELRSASSALNEALSSLRKAERKDVRLSEFSERLESQAIETQDIFESIRDHLSSLSFSETEIESMNSRIAVIQKMKRRFGGSVEAAIEKREEYREKLALIEDSSDVLANLEKRLGVLQKDLEKNALALSKKRHEGAKSLSQKIEKNLHKLGMPAAEFHIAVSDTSDYGPHGKDMIQYLISANKGEKTSEIQNTSSGGELFRLMLAIKVSLKSAGTIESMLFDEVDAGIGGSVANAVAEELLNLSSSRQVITITHLAQIAAKANQHYKVYKKEEKGRTISHITKLEGEERVKEIARILSGDASDISLEHARRLLEVQV